MGLDPIAKKRYGEKRYTQYFTMLKAYDFSTLAIILFKQLSKHHMIVYGRMHWKYIYIITVYPSTSRCQTCIAQ